MTLVGHQLAKDPAVVQGVGQLTAGLRGAGASGRPAQLATVLAAVVAMERAGRVAAELEAGGVFGERQCEGLVNLLRSGFL